MKTQQEYCRDILARIDMIRRFTEGGEAFFLQDERTQESVMRCFEIIGEIVKRLDTTLKDAYPLIDWKSYAGFRDVLIHQYDMILLDKVWDTVQTLALLKMR
jgi:uncharacterized protein with HEPN domain